MKPNNDPNAIEAAFRLRDGLYLLGSLEKGVTIYRQQLRAHNLAWALWERHKDCSAIPRVAVVGGGIAGLTVSACLFSLFKDRVDLTLFEKLLDFCPLQQGSDSRWVHPKIYEWPYSGSRAPSASLPVLNWSEGRASDVARTILNGFGSFCELADQTKFSAYLGLRSFRIDPSSNEIHWIGHKAKRTGAFFKLDRSEGNNSIFDVIILATGFGLELNDTRYNLQSYWRNEQLGQPTLSGSTQRYLISGFGDGALVDLCRLTIERFRQDTIVYELFPGEQLLQAVEQRLSIELNGLDANGNVFDLLRSLEGDFIGTAIDELSRRIRKDSQVMLHIRGRSNDVNQIRHIFGPRSSFLNRLLTYILYRCGALEISFDELDTAVEQYQVLPSNVICRHGANTLEHLRGLFGDASLVERSLLSMKTNQPQQPRRAWRPGVFSVPEP